MCTEPHPFLLSFINQTAKEFPVSQMCQLSAFFCFMSLKIKHLWVYYLEDVTTRSEHLFIICIISLHEYLTRVVIENVSQLELVHCVTTLRNRPHCSQL